MMRIWNETLRVLAPALFVPMVLVAVISPTQVAAAEEPFDVASPLCSQTPLDSAWKQIPTCKKFAPLESTGSYDPLTYRENTDNSLVALEGSKIPSDVKLEVLTPNQCSNPRFFSDPSLIDKGVSYLLFKSGSKGMCRIRISSAVESKSTVLELPVKTWSVSVVVIPTILSEKIPNKSALLVGESVQLTNIRFRYPGSDYDLGPIVPVLLKISTQSHCSIEPGVKILSTSSGDCEVQLSWPSFTFGSRVFQATQKNTVLFSAKTTLEINQESESKKQSATALAAKRKADAKLCKPTDQSRLRNAYAPVVASNNRASAIRSKLDRVNYLIGQVGKNGPIQLPPSEYSDLLAGYPVLANSRQVPIFRYQAILQGSLIGESKNYQNAFALANLAYSKASAGCKKVVGKP